MPTHPASTKNCCACTRLPAGPHSRVASSRHAHTPCAGGAEFFVTRGAEAGQDAAQWPLCSTCTAVARAAAACVTQAKGPGTDTDTDTDTDANADADASLRQRSQAVCSALALPDAQFAHLLRTVRGSLRGGSAACLDTLLQSHCAVLTARQAEHLVAVARSVSMATAPPRRSARRGAAAAPVVRLEGVVGPRVVDKWNLIGLPAFCYWAAPSMRVATGSPSAPTSNAAIARAALSQLKCCYVGHAVGFVTPGQMEVVLSRVQAAASNHAKTQRQRRQQPHASGSGTGSGSHGGAASASVAPIPSSSEFVPLSSPLAATMAAPRANLKAWGRVSVQQVAAPRAPRTSRSPPRQASPVAASPLASTSSASSVSPQRSECGAQAGGGGKSDLPVAAASRPTGAFHFGKGGIMMPVAVVTRTVTVTPAQPRSLKQHAPPAALLPASVSVVAPLSSV